MRRNDDSELPAAFAELQQRLREQAPPFGAMRERALRVAESRSHDSTPRPGWPRLPLTAAAVGMAVLFGWWIMRTPDPVPDTSRDVAATQRVEELLATIEKEIELTEVISSPEYATDILLTQN